MCVEVRFVNNGCTKLETVVSEGLKRRKIEICFRWKFHVLLRKKISTLIIKVEGHFEPLLGLNRKIKLKS